jgi:metal-dependent amidase/aminoacylase/carboxypeptidase family protein
MVEIDIDVNYPVTFNHEAEAALALSVAAGIAGADPVDGDLPPMMGGEDFSYMLQKRPGALIFLGNGDTAGLHNPAYDFNDEIIPSGISYWVEAGRDDAGRLNSEAAALLAKRREAVMYVARPATAGHAHGRKAP